MRWGTWSLARAAEGGALERAADQAAQVVVPGRPAGVVRIPLRALLTTTQAAPVHHQRYGCCRTIWTASHMETHCLLETVGLHFALRNRDRLIGFARGERRDFGVCQVQRRTVKWGWWFPHLGIAVDLDQPQGGDVEVEAKAEFSGHGARFLYFAPGFLWEELQEAAYVRHPSGQEQAH